MAIWRYPTSAREPEYVWSDNCPFCKSYLNCIHHVVEDTRQMRLSLSNHSNTATEVWICQVCGWWKAKERQESETTRPWIMNHSTRGACASLCDLDLTDIQQPVQEIQKFLTAKYELRHIVHPQMFEETVASVFRSLGYEATVTAYSGDDGIDVILQKGEDRIGVQVKRYRNSISVEQIRSLAGALVLNQMTKGIFVTTSRFERGSARTVERYKVLGHRIELIDAPRFFDMLKLSQMDARKDFEQIDIQRCLSSLQIIDEYQSNFLF
jgi:restriction system protein